MKLIKKIHEGESWASAIIGWKTINYRGLNEDSEAKALKLSLYLNLVLIKIEIIIPWHEKKQSSFL